MGEDDRTLTLLEEIRDLQREHLAEHRRVAQELLAAQQRAMERQQRLGQIYRRIALPGAALVGILLVLLVYLLVRWSDYLFR